MRRLLIVDDEAVIRQTLRRLLERHGYQVEDAADIASALEILKQNIDIVLCDLRLPDGDGTQLLTSGHTQPVVMMTSFASVRSAVEAMRLGARDYIAKPFDHDELLLTLERVLEGENLKRQNQALKSDAEKRYPVHGMIGNSQAMSKVRSYIDKLAPLTATVLIGGESGTGKELVARALHEHGPRKNGPLVAVNCGAIAEGVIESELFGHAKGAFTGASEKRIGLVESAHSGTLFLDEIAEMPLAAQTRLLRLLEDHQVRPVGSNQSHRVDIRLVAATHRRLDEEVAAGRFRADLFYRLRVMEILLPPLRERGEDVLQLAEHFLQHAAEHGHAHPLQLDEGAQTALRAYRWPGNVRELQHAIERASILCDGQKISAELLAISSTGHPAQEAHKQWPSLDTYFRQYLQENQHHMTETELAQGLGISRKALWERRQRMEIPRPKSGT